MKKVIVLNGVAQCGKDTFANGIKSRCSDNGYGYSLVSSVDLVKDMLELAGISRHRKTDKDRKLMSDLKDILTYHSDIPFKDVVSKINRLEIPDINSIFVVMCREPEEIQKFKDYYRHSCVTIIINRDKLKVPNNHADRGVEGFQYDIRVSNNGTKDDLKSIAGNICDTIF